MTLTTRALAATFSFALIAALGPSLSFAQTAGSNAKPTPDKAAPAKAGAALSPQAEAALQQKVENYLRNIYAWGADINIKPGPLTPAPMGDMYQTTVEVSAADGGGSDSAIVFVSKDGRYILRGELDDMNVDPFADIVKQMELKGAAAKGPADAKVTVVEFGDLECPVCKQLESILREVLPEYPQVRFVFKDFPLESIHPWAMEASVIGHCTLQQSSDLFWKYHDRVYDDQDQINPTTAPDQLTDIATTAGADKDKLKACATDPKSTEFIRASLKNGMDLGVNSTPTVFVDGRKFVGPNPNALKEFIEYDLHPNSTTTPQPHQ